MINWVRLRLNDKLIRSRLEDRRIILSVDVMSVKESEIAPNGFADAAARRWPTMQIDADSVAITYVLPPLLKTLILAFILCCVVVSWVVSRSDLLLRF